MLALERANIAVERYVAYEIDKYAISISTRNYPQIEQRGDVTTADFSEFKGFDLLLGGSPCTYWSIAKNNREVTPNGVGGQLFMHYVRALHESQCKYFLYENNFSIHKNIQNFISEKLGVQPIMINSSLVSGQNRKRLYWTNIPNVKPPDDKGILLKDILEAGQPLNDIDGRSRTIKAQYAHTSIANAVRNDGYGATMVAESIRIGHIGQGRQAERIYSVNGKSVSLKATCGGLGAKTGLYKIDLPDGDYVIRTLTPVECERLQTIPDGYTGGVSNTQRYKCIGNGWTISVISSILENIP